MEPLKENKRQFPAEEIQLVFQEYFANKSSVQAILNENFNTDSNSNITIFPQPGIDSLSVAELFDLLEPIVGFELPLKLIEAGGYDDGEGLLDDILPKLEELWQKHSRETLI